MFKYLILLLLLPTIAMSDTSLLGVSNIVFKDNGNIGLGSTDPSAMLDVAGNIKSSNKFVGDGSLLTNLPGVPLNITPGVSHSLVSSTSSTGFQISSSKPVMAFYSIKISTTATISGSAEGEVYLETASTNSTTPSDWSMASKISNGQAFSLAVALQGIQNLGQPLLAMIPAGYYVRIRTNNVSGTPTYTYVTGQETIIG